MSSSNGFWIVLIVVLAVNVLAWVVINRLQRDRFHFFRSFLRCAGLVLSELLAFAVIAITAAFLVYVTGICGFYEEGEGLLNSAVSLWEETTLASLVQEHDVLASKEDDYLFYYQKNEDGYRSNDLTSIVPETAAVIFDHNWQPVEYYQPSALLAAQEETYSEKLIPNAKSYTAQAKKYAQNDYQVSGTYGTLPKVLQKIVAWDYLNNDGNLTLEAFWEESVNWKDYLSFTNFWPDSTPALPLGRIVRDVFRTQQTFGYCQKMILQKATAADLPATENARTIELENLTGVVKPYCIRAAGTTAVDEQLKKGLYSEEDVYYVFMEYTVRPRKMFLDTLHIGRRMLQAALIFGVNLALLFFVMILQFREKERRLYKQQNDLFYAIAHELKTPMGVVMLHGEKVLESETAQDKDARTLGMLEEIKDMNQRLMDVLAQSKLQGGRYRMKWAEVSLTALAQEVADGYEPLTEDKDISVELEGEGLAIYADGYLIKYAISNYFSNAVKFTPNGGQIKISVQKKKRRAQLVVWNSGSHIPQGSAGHIWDPFSKIGNGGDNAKQGSGLGLSIVRSIVSLHSGSCGAENKNGGVAFWCSFPMRKRKKR